MTAPELEPGEKLLAEWRSDKGRYWRDHGVMALAGMAGVGVVLWWLDVQHIAIGSLGALLAIAVRGLYLQGEQMKAVWRLTDRRVILPHGGTVGLMEIETQRKLLGDVQLVTRSGDKHLMKHLADADAVLDALSKARDRRTKRRAD
jgi:hypothetical protein